jgi:acyl-CoA dehydrogenase
MDNEFGNAFGQLLADRCTPDVVRSIERGESTDALWRDLVESGFVDALVPEAQEGAGLSLNQVLPLVQACGYHALPLPFAQTMVARAVLAHAGRPWPDTAITLDAIGDALPAEDRSALHAALTTALIAGAAARVLEMSIAHAQQRTQFGKAIGSFQAVQHQLSVMAEQACAARMAAQLSFASGTHLPDRTLAAMGKTVAGEAAAVIAASSHAVHGAIGITAEFDLQLYTRRLLAWRVQAGSPTHWAMKVAREWWSGPQSGAIDFTLERLRAAQF